MDFKLIIFKLSLSLPIVVSCTIAIGQATNTISNDAYRNNAFAIELFKKLYKKDSNVFFSPYSIRSSLALVCAGAENKTKAQMCQVVHFDADNKKTVQLFLDFNNKFMALNEDTTIKFSIANALWKKDDIHFPIKEDYLEIVKKYSGADIFPMPSNATPINNWVSSKTKGTIPSIISDKTFNPNAKMILTNTIYFKGMWHHQFNPIITEYLSKKLKFKTLQNGSIDAAFMGDMFYGMGYYENDKTTALELGYTNSNFYMTLVLPKTNSSITELVKDFNTSYLSTMNFKRNKVWLCLPKFSFSSKHEFDNVLNKMGMSEAFNENKADFRGITDEPKIAIKKILQSAFISINEKGTEAGAATNIAIRTGASMDEPFNFIADRPFMFLISEHYTGNILFMGAVMNPCLH